MNRLSKENIEKIKSRGLEIKEYSDGILTISKPYGFKGNYLPGKRKEGNIKPNNGELSDSPTMRLFFNNGIGKISVWDYIPGPGPGDFTEEFTLENEMTNFVINYFFKPNSYFQAKIEDDIDHRSAINVKEIKVLLEKTVKYLEEEFGKEEIELGRISFNKIPLENWHKGDFVGEFSEVKVQHGILSSEAFYLKRKRHEGREIEAKDLYGLAHILTELSIRTQEKNKV